MSTPDKQRPDDRDSRRDQITTESSGGGFDASIDPEKPVHPSQRLGVWAEKIDGLIVSGNAWTYGPGVDMEDLAHVHAVQCPLPGCAADRAEPCATPNQWPHLARVHDALYELQLRAYEQQLTERDAEREPGHGPDQ